MIEISEEGIIFCGGLLCDGRHRCNDCPLPKLKNYLNSIINVCSIN